MRGDGTLDSLRVVQEKIIASPSSLSILGGLVPGPPPSPAQAKNPQMLQSLLDKYLHVTYMIFLYTLNHL